jgi:hypothetical protein
MGLSDPFQTTFEGARQGASSFGNALTNIAQLVLAKKMEDKRIENEFKQKEKLLRAEAGIKQEYEQVKQKRTQDFIAGLLGGKGQQQEGIGSALMGGGQGQMAVTGFSLDPNTGDVKLSYGESPDVKQKRELEQKKQEKIIAGVSGEVSGRVTLAKESIKNIQDIKKTLFPGGTPESFKRTTAFASNLPGGTLPLLPQRGWGQAEQDVFRKMGAALSGRQLIQTGVAAGPEETAKLVAQFAPSGGSNPQAAWNGLNELEDFYKMYLKETVPEERFKENATDEETKTQQISQSTPSQSNPANLVGALGLATGAGYGLRRVNRALAPQRNKLASNLMNSIIKPADKEYMFGKNPGLAVAQEGISGISLESIGTKVDQRLNQLNTYAKELRSLDTNKAKVVNLSQMLDPFQDVLAELKKQPLTQKAKIAELVKMTKDIAGNIPEGNVKSVPVDAAYNIKGVVQKMQKWEVKTSADDLMNKALKKVYHNIDSAIDTAIPELKSVNSRISNLISAKQAIKKRVIVLSKQDKTALGNLLTLPIKGTVGSTAVKSNLAKILTNRIGKLGKSLPPTLGVASTLMDAIKFSSNPGAYMLQLADPTLDIPDDVIKDKKKFDVWLGKLIQEEGTT